MNAIHLKTDPRGVSTVTLSRPELHNAINDDAADLLIATLETLAADDSVRIVVLTGDGISFSAGTDPEGMRRLAAASETELRRHDQLLSRLFSTLDALPKPTIAHVQGSAFSIGAGLVACCDIAISSSEALFSFSDVRLGGIPAVFAPYIIRAIGERAARRYFITGERFNAGKAKRLGLIHQVTEPDELDIAVHRQVEQLLLNGPQAMQEAKLLVHDLAKLSDAEASATLALNRSVRIRASAEGREGLLAFLEQRKPDWIVD